MRVELNVEQIERQLRDKERTIAVRLDRLFPARARRERASPSPARSSMSSGEGRTWKAGAMVLAGTGLVLLGALERPSRRKASVQGRIAGGRIALFAGVTLLAYIAGRHLAEKRAVLVAMSLRTSPPPGAPP